MISAVEPRQLAHDDFLLQTVYPPNEGVERRELKVVASQSPAAAPERLTGSFASPSERIDGTEGGDR